MKAGMKTVLRTAAWSMSALLLVGAAAGTATAAAHNHKKHAGAAATDTTGSSGTPAARPRMLHDLATVENSDGTFDQYATQMGTVTAVSDTSITVRSDDGYSATYVIGDDSHVVKDGKKATTDDVASGDTVFVRAENEDGAFTAELIGDGKPPVGPDGPGGHGKPPAGPDGPGGPGGPGGHRPPPPGGPGAPGGDGDGT